MSNKVTIQGPVGRLEGELWLPEGGATPVAAAVVCHPHPLHGGTMKNNVVHRTARGLNDAGLAVLRFNFRGVGASEGVHDGHGAEEEDLAAALTYLAEAVPGVPLWAGGFSFGSRTLVGLAPRDARIQRVLLVALPVIAYDCQAALEVTQPGAIIMAGDDTFGTLEVLSRQLPELVRRFHVEEIPGVDHFFTGKLDELRLRVRDWSTSQLQAH
ncbi:MAG: alpha/beta hydrolase [Planctomycetota bacterium]|nr:alpha/beta hydrolase [Planctomycetota bacterium]MDG1982941.1 alpha/beta hydrolase [Planctomycetota bacterium]